MSMSAEKEISRTLMAVIIQNLIKTPKLSEPPATSASGKGYLIWNVGTPIFSISLRVACRLSLSRWLAGADIRMYLNK